MAMRRAEGEAQGRPTRRRYDPVPLARIAPALRRAVLVGEDHRFYEHGGVDFQEIREALGYRREDFSWSRAADRRELWRALGRAWARRDRLRGASTLTQQLAKNLYLSPSRNPLRKIKEAVTAYRLEAALGKERILELYLNVVELGPGIWGAEAASETYFSRPTSRLTEEQAALLAATLPSPLRGNPRDHAGRIAWRQDLILRRMGAAVADVVAVPPADVQVLDSVPAAPADTGPGRR